MMTYTTLHLFSGIGGGALGFQNAGFKSIGNFDFDEGACRSLTYLTGEAATPVDLQELQPEQMRQLCGERRPDVLFTSPPCKSFSGNLGEALARTKKYRSMSTLAFRGIWLALMAWEQPPPLIIMENVPRIMTRGREWLDDVIELLESHGYAVRETVHDCGEIGGLAQRRRRFLLVARHEEQVPELLYTPPIKSLRGVGEVIGALPIPGESGGPMHRLPRISELNQRRFNAIPAGGDWRDLPEELALTCRPRATAYGVLGWDGTAGTIVGYACHDNGRYSVADPRMGIHRPLTTLELAALQGFPTKVNGEWLKLDGNNNSMWRQWIGNAVPVQAAEAIARECIETLNAAAKSKFRLRSEPVWVGGEVSP